MFTRNSTPYKKLDARINTRTGNSNLPSQRGVTRLFLPVHLISVYGGGSKGVKGHCRREGKATEERCKSKEEPEGGRGSTRKRGGN